MAPVKPGQHSFKFDPTALKAAREKAGLTQAAIAELIGVPVNTVSRWETGASPPDAHALAAYFSVCKDRGVTVSFFKGSARSTQPAVPKRTKLTLAWDFQNMARDADDISEDVRYLRSYFDLLHLTTKPSRDFWAYGSTVNFLATQQLRDAGFDVSDQYWNIDKELIENVEAACEKRPSRQVLYLIANDGDYAEMLRKQRSGGVETHLIGTDQCSDRLVRAVEPGNFVHFDKPYVVVESVDVLRRLNGKSLTRSDIGNQIKQALDEDGIYPQDAGFSSRNPYGSLLSSLELSGLIALKQHAGGNKVTVTVTATRVAKDA